LQGSAGARGFWGSPALGEGRPVMEQILQDLPHVEQLLLSMKEKPEEYCKVSKAQSDSIARHLGNTTVSAKVLAELSDKA